MTYKRPKASASWSDSRCGWCGVHIAMHEDCDAPSPRWVRWVKAVAPYDERDCEDHQPDEYDDQPRRGTWVGEVTETSPDAGEGV